MPGGNDLPPADLDRHTGELLAEEARLEGAARDMDSRLSGLKDIDLLLALARVKLRLCLAMMKRAEGRGRSSFESLEVPVGRRAASAIRIVESLVSQNVSEDQHGIVQTSPLFAETKRLLEEFLISGGGGFLEPLQLDEHKTRVLSRTVATSIRKFMGEDDRYPPLDIERFPPFLQTLLLTLFPVFIRLRPQKPPYGIEEGEEVTYTSPAMRVPLSQAIHYMENELLPELERRLAADPGHPDLQEEERKVPRAARAVQEHACPSARGAGASPGEGPSYRRDYRVHAGRRGPRLPAPCGQVPQRDEPGQEDGAGSHGRCAPHCRARGERGDRPGVQAPEKHPERQARQLPNAEHEAGSILGLLGPAPGLPFSFAALGQGPFEELVQVVRSGSLGDAERFIEAVISRDQGSKQAAALPGP